MAAILDSQKHKSRKAFLQFGFCAAAYGDLVG